MKKLVLIHLFSLLLLLGTTGNTIKAQEIAEELWRDVSETAILQKQNRQIVPIFYRTLELNVDRTREVLNRAPVEFTETAKTAKVVLSLPMPNGTFSRFNIVNSPVMELDLAVKYPEIQTYSGQGIDDPTATVRFDLTPAGFHAMILSANGTVFIDPYSKGNISNYISYYKKDFIVDDLRRQDFICYFEPDANVAKEISKLVATGINKYSGTQLRTYRLAVATTYEYTTYHGGTVSAGLAAVVTSVNRVNGVYEKEVAVRMILVANNNLIIYTTVSDPYTNTDGSTMLSQNQTNLDAVIGSANYDIGHVFSTGGGGVAYLGCVCQSSIKAGGVTGSSAPIGDPFDIDYVAHEMGHQFGANHTFNGTTGSCAGANRNASTAYEPGSGTTIMAYAGICSPQNIQMNSDDYFHLASIVEIVTYTTIGAGNGCPVITTSGNNAPVVNAGTRGYSIPINTPFILTGSATDLNSDPLTYCWEEYDLGVAGAPNLPVGTAPIFRSFKGVTSPSRTFPKIADIINNTQVMGEILPSYSRAMKFRLTARDNRTGGGGVGWDSISFSVTSTAGPFQISAPNTAIAWAWNTTQMVTWSVANTNISPVSCSNVKILLSTDGGYTYPTVMVESTPNDGTENISVPSILTTQARIRVEAVGNIFFDISNVNFTIAQSTIAVTAPNGGESWAIGTNQTIAWTSGNIPGNVKIEYTTDGTNYTVIAASTPNSGTYSWTIPNTPSTTAKVRVSDAADAATNDISNANFTIGSAPIQASTNKLDDFNRANSNIVGNTPTTPTSLTWNEIETVSSTAIQINSNRLQLGSTTAGRDFAYVDLNSLIGYPTQLNLSGGVITWAFNFRNTRTDPSGFDAGNYGVAFILGKTTNDVTTGDGYAVIIGQSLATDPIRLARFTAGPDANSNFTNIISGNDYGAEYISVKVTYNPAGNNWSLYAESNASSFPQANPVNTTTQIGSTTSNNTYTASALRYMGCLWNHSTGSENAIFDDIYISDPSGNLPIQLASFVGSYVGNGAAKLAWETISEVNNYGFWVQKYNGTDYETIVESFQAGETNAPDGKSYFWIDDNATGSDLRYMLKQQDNDGLVNYFGPVIMLNPTNVPVEAVPSVFALNQNYPNPFNPTTIINYQLATDNYTTLKVYNLIGKEVGTLVNGHQTAGCHQVTFDGTQLSNGIYFYKLQSGKNVEVKKLTLVK